MNLLKEGSSPPSISAVDLFCGVGGLTYGLRKAGIKVVAGLDIDETCKYPFEENNNEENNKIKFISKDIRKFTGAELSELYPKGSIKILGCAHVNLFLLIRERIRIEVLMRGGVYLMTLEGWLKR